MLSLLPLSLQSLYLLQSRVASTQLIRTVQHARTAFCRSRREYMQSGEELTEEFCTLLRNSPLRQHFVQFSHPFTHFTTFPFFFCFSRGCVIHLGRERERERDTIVTLSVREKWNICDQKSGRAHSPEQQETSRCCHITPYLSMFSWPNVIFPNCTLKNGSFVIYVAIYAASKGGPVAAMCQYVPCDCVICQYINKQYKVVLKTSPEGLTGRLPPSSSIS